MYVARLRLYALIKEGYRAMLESKVSHLNEVRERLNQRRNYRERKKSLKELDKGIDDINLK